MAGPGQISWRKLRAHLGVSRISMATEEEVLAVTGYAVGTVSPLGLAHPIRILADMRYFHPRGDFPRFRGAGGGNYHEICRFKAGIGRN